jgi:dTDP-4-dehydrorhamnose 3,5-epimerase
MSELTVTESALRGLYIIDLAIFDDARGSFREAYQAAKLEKLGLPPLKPVQWNISENLRAGVTRGIHDEPWDKYVHVPNGSVFAAVTDLRPESPTFGQHVTLTLDRTNALYISRGFGNAFQVLETNTVYCYLTSAHWSAEQKYINVRYNDPDIGIVWPLKIGTDDLSEKDQHNPSLREVFSEKWAS